MKQRVLVCGGRDYGERGVLYAVLDQAHLMNPIVCLICGGASGADSLAVEWALSRGVPEEVYLADWGRYGNGAGPIRNALMLAEGKPDIVVAFPRRNGKVGAGTADMCRRAKAAGVPVAKVLGRRSSSAWDPGDNLGEG